MNTSIDPLALVNAIGDAVVVCDAEGHIVMWNPGAERMFGYTQAEALGHSLDLIIPERLRRRHNEGYAKSMATGTTRYGNDLLRVPAVNKAGESMSIAFTVAMLFGPDGKANAVAAVIRNETARFNEERALKKRLAELEAQLPPGSERP